MDGPVDRRSFLTLAGRALATGALYRVGGALGGDSRRLAMLDLLGRQNGEPVSPFTFVQLSDTHVGFEGPPDPLGTRAFEQAVAEINGLARPPDLVLVTGDLIHDSDKEGETLARMRRFKAIAAGLNVKNLKVIPGEHDAALDGGERFRSEFGDLNYAFDHKGVHFVALDNVSRGRPAVGAEQLAWLRRDLARFAPSTPLVVFTHRPLFDLKPEWEWYTSDGDAVMAILAPFTNVTVLYGHIHRLHERRDGHLRHLAARSLIFAFPDPAAGVDKNPLPFDPGAPFRNLGLRRIELAASGGLAVTDVELTRREFAGVVGSHQLLKGAPCA